DFRLAELFSLASRIAQREPTRERAIAAWRGVQAELEGERRTGGPGEEDLLAGLALSHHHLGLLLLDAGRSEQSAQHFEEATRDWQRLVTAQPKRWRPRHLLADDSNHLGEIHRLAGR